MFNKKIPKQIFLRIVSSTFFFVVWFELRWDEMSWTKTWISAINRFQFQWNTENTKNKCVFECKSHMCWIIFPDLHAVFFWNRTYFVLQFLVCCNMYTRASIFIYIRVFLATFHVCENLCVGWKIYWWCLMILSTFCPPATLFVIANVFAWRIFGIFTLKRFYFKENT